MIYRYDFNNHSGRQQLSAKIEKIAISPRLQHDNDNPHMKGTPQLSLQSFSLFEQMMINKQLQWQALQSSSY